jgi:flavodoxin
MQAGHLQEVPLSRILVVYCSRSGHTRSIARRIAEGCGADIEEITDVAARDGLAGALRSAVEAVLGIEAAIHPVRHPPKGYDLVVVGTPVWCWNVASPVRGYLTAYGAGLHRVALFCTFGGSGQDKVLGDLQRLCGRASVATLALSEAECAAPGHRAKLSKFVRTVLRSLRDHDVGEAKVRVTPTSRRTGTARIARGT